MKLAIIVLPFLAFVRIHCQQQQFAEEIDKEKQFQGDPNYQFQYTVNDPTTGDIKTQEETREGDVIRGFYQLLDSDGQVRTVSYVADALNGFRATVTRSDPDGSNAKRYVFPPEADTENAQRQFIKPVLPSIPPEYFNDPQRQFAGPQRPLIQGPPPPQFIPFPAAAGDQPQRPFVGGAEPQRLIAPQPQRPFVGPAEPQRLIAPQPQRPFSTAEPQRQFTPQRPFSTAEPQRQFTPQRPTNSPRPISGQEPQRQFGTPPEPQRLFAGAEPQRQFGGDEAQRPFGETERQRQFALPQIPFVVEPERKIDTVVEENQRIGGGEPQRQIPLNQRQFGTSQQAFTGQTQRPFSVAEPQRQFGVPPQIPFGGLEPQSDSQANSEVSQRSVGGIEAQTVGSGPHILESGPQTEDQQRSFNPQKLPIEPSRPIDNLSQNQKSTSGVVASRPFQSFIVVPDLTDDSKPSEKQNKPNKSDVPKPVVPKPLIQTAQQQYLFPILEPTRAPARLSPTPVTYHPNRISSGDSTRFGGAGQKPSKTEERKQKPSAVLPTPTPYQGDSNYYPGYFPSPYAYPSQFNQAQSGYPILNAAGSNFYNARGYYPPYFPAATQNSAAGKP